MRTHTRSPIGLVLSLLMVAAGVFMAATAVPASADVTGTARGHAFTLEGTLLGSVQSRNRIDLPPGGATSQPLNFNNVLVLNSSSASSTCTGVTNGPSVTASCIATANNVSVGIGLTTLFQAETLTSQSNSIDTGSGPSSNNTGTLFHNACVRQAPLAQCNPVSAPQNIPINFPGIVTGSINFNVQTPRTSDNGMQGSGLTVAAVQFSLTLLGQPLTSFSLLEADSFVGGVTVLPTATPTTAPPTATPPPGATATPTPPPGATATPTPPGNPTATPTTPPGTNPTATPVTPAPTSTPVPNPTATPTTPVTNPTATPTLVPTGPVCPPVCPQACPPFCAPPACPPVCGPAYQYYPMYRFLPLVLPTVAPASVSVAVQPVTTQAPAPARQVLQQPVQAPVYSAAPATVRQLPSAGDGGFAATTQREKLNLALLVAGFGMMLAGGAGAWRNRPGSASRHGDQG